MPKYVIYATKTISLETTIEADTADEALAIVDRDYIIDDFTETNVEFKFDPYTAIEVKE
jgi:hypothetical protein